MRRAYEQYSSIDSDIAKNNFMTSLKEQNEVLYYRLILDHLNEMFPVIYTPTEGEAIANYSRQFRRPEGCFLNIDDIDRVEHDVAKFGAPDEIDLIVVSDGEQVSFHMRLVIIGDLAMHIRSSELEIKGWGPF